jgi:quinol monooxygenase YgiN
MLHGEKAISPIGTLIVKATSMILSQITIYPAQGYAASIIDVLQSVQVLLATAPDCLLASVFIESVENGAILYLEKWRSRESLDEHLRSIVYMRVLEALEMSCRSPDVTFIDGREMGGLEIVEMARSFSTKNA